MKFSERHGIKPVRAALQLEGMDNALRNSLWNVISQFVFSRINIHQGVADSPYANSITRILWADFFKSPVDSRSYLCNTCYQSIRKWFFESKWYEVYDLIEFTLEKLFFLEKVFANAVNQKKEFVNSCNEYLEREMSGYRIVGDQVTPITSENEINAIEEAQQQSNRFRPISTHLTTALQLLSNREKPDYRNSIKESISAVESLCCIITNSPKATLGEAIGNLEKMELRFMAH